MVFFGADFVMDLQKQTPCTGKYVKKIDSKTQLGLVSIGFCTLDRFFSCECLQKLR